MYMLSTENAVSMCTGGRETVFSPPYSKCTNLLEEEVLLLELCMLLKLETLEDGLSGSLDMWLPNALCLPNLYSRLLLPLP